MATKTAKTPTIPGVTKARVRVSFKRKTGEKLTGKTTGPAVKEANGHWIGIKGDDGAAYRRRPSELTAI